jgi:hypothetical protein
MSTLGDRGRTAQLRELIRARLSAGTLPPLSPHHRVFAGYGEQQTCHACGEPIERSEVVYEIDVRALPASDGTHARTDTLAMHLACFDVWVQESSTAGQPPRAASGEPPLSACGGELPMPSRARRALP